MLAELTAAAMLPRRGLSKTGEEVGGRGLGAEERATGTEAFWRLLMRRRALVVADTGAPTPKFLPIVARS